MRRWISRATVLWLSACLQVELSPVAAVQDPGVPGVRRVLGTRAALHPRSIADLAFSAEGLVATASINVARVWDTDGNLVRECGGPSKILWTVDLSSRGDLLAAGGDEADIWLWSLPAGKLEGVLKGHTAAISSLRFSSDGRVLVSCDQDGDVRVWDVPARKNLSAFKGAGRSGEVAVSPDGGILASGDSDGKIFLRSLSTGAALATLEGQDRPILCIRFSPKADRVAGLATLVRGKTESEDHSVYVWDVATGKLLHRLGGREKPIMNCAFSADGRRLFLVMRDGTFSAWDVDGERELARAAMGPVEVDPVAFSPDARRIATATPFHLRFRVWNLDPTKLEIREAGAIVGHETAVVACSVSPDGKRALSLENGGVLIEWALESGEVRSKRLLRGCSTEGTAISPAMNLVGIGRELYKSETGERLRVLGDSGFHCGALGFSHDEKLVALGDGAAGGKIILLDTRSGAALQEFGMGRNVSIKCVAFSPDDLLLACAGDNDSIGVYDVRRGRLLHKLDAHSGRVNRLTFSPDGRLASAGEDRTIRLWSLSSGREVERLQEETSVLDAVFSSDGRYLLCATAAGLTHWDLRSRTPLRRYPNGDRISAVSCARNGRYAVTACANSTLISWDLFDPRAFPGLSPDLEAHWKNLLSEDPVAAHAAAVAFLSVPRQAAGILKRVLAPVEVKPDDVRGLIRKLDGNDPAERQEADRRLREKSPFTGSVLSEELAQATSRETILRLRSILQDLEEGFIMPGDHLQRMRSIRILELMGSQESRDVLRELSEKAPSRLEAKEAKAAIARLLAP